MAASFTAAASTSDFIEGAGGYSGTDLPPAPTSWRSPLAPNITLVCDAATHLARRAAHGPTPELAGQIRQMGRTAWIDAQLNPAGINDSACDAIIRNHYSWSLLSNREIKSVTGDRPWKAAPVLVRATVLRQQFSKRVLFESVVEVMSDQLYVAAEGKSESFVTGYDRDVIRKHALGKFSDMLYACMTHSGMMMYLDNWLNERENPNENLGRELLELYTVGTGNFTETDVRQSSLMLTGHGLSWKTYEYEYHDWAHHVGPIKVMGFSHANGAGQGPAALKAYTNYLANHRATAVKLCRRLATRFVSDNPSTALVNSLADVYQRNGTSIKAVVRAILMSSEFANSVGQKWRRPGEWLASMVKLGKPTYVAPSATQSTNPWGMLGTTMWYLDRAQHKPKGWPAVNGYPDVAPAWMSTNALLTAWNVALAVADRWDGEVKVQEWAPTLGVKAGQNVWDVARKLAALTGFTWRASDLNALAMVLASQRTTVPPSGYTLTDGDVRWHFTVALRLVFASPYFLLR